MYLKYHYWEELGLTFASMYLAVPGLVVMIVGGYVGFQIGGQADLNVGLDIGLGVALIGMSGMGIHYLRSWVNLIYRRILFRGQEPLFMDSAPPPAPFMRPFLLSNDWDFLVQVFAAIVGFLIALRLNP